MMIRTKLIAAAGTLAVVGLLLIGGGPSFATDSPTPTPYPTSTVAPEPTVTPTPTPTETATPTPTPTPTVTPPVTPKPTPPAVKPPVKPAPPTLAATGVPRIFGLLALIGAGCLAFGSLILSRRVGV